MFALLMGCSAAPASLRVASAISASHGICPKKADEAYGARAARLFARPLPYQVYHCIARTKAQILSHSGCSRARRNTVFITLEKPVRVSFMRGDSQTTASVAVFGAEESWRGDTILYLPVKAFPRPPLPAGAKAYTGPEPYGLFGVSGDPLGLSRAECAGLAVFE